MDKLPEPFNMLEIMAKAAEKTPYVVVAFQECERMNILTNEIRRSLKELNLGLKVCDIDTVLHHGSNLGNVVCFFLNIPAFTNEINGTKCSVQVWYQGNVSCWITTSLSSSATNYRVIVRQPTLLFPSF